MAKTRVKTGDFINQQYFVDADSINNIPSTIKHIFINTEIDITGGLTINEDVHVTIFANGKFTGSGTLILQDNYIFAEHQIFGTNVTVEGSILNEKINPYWFGAKGDDSNDDSIPINKAVQFAINNGIAGRSYTVYIKNGFYRLYSPILLLKITSNALQNINIQLIGESKGYDYGTILQPYYYDKPTVIAQACRSLKIKGFKIQGRGSYYENCYDYDYLTDENQYDHSATLRDNRYSPYCGISIDPFSNLDLGSDAYPDLDQYYGTGSKGSSNTIIEECLFRRFVIGISLSTSAQTQLNDSILIKACTFQTNKICIANGQDQIRGLYIENIHVNACETVVDSQRYGSQSGASIQVNGAVITHARWLFLLNLRRGNAIFTNVYAESFHSIGISENFSTRYAYNVQFDSCQFKFIRQFETYKTLGFHFYMEQTEALFNNCAFGSYVGYSHPMTFFTKTGGKAVFNNCTLDGLIFADGIEMEYNKCNFFYAEKTGIASGTDDSFIDFINETFPSDFASLSGITESWQWFSVKATVTNNDDGTISITNHNDAFLIGDKVLIRSQVNSFDYGLEGYKYLCCYIQEYDSGNSAYVVKGVMPNIVLDEGDNKNVLILYRPRESNPRTFGDFDSSGNQITNVTDIDTFALRELIIDPDGNYLRVQSIDTETDTLTMHRNGSSSGTYTGMEIIRSRKPISKTTEGTSAPASGSYFKGDYVTNTDIVDTGGGVYVKGWLCVAGGQPGTWIAENF